MSPNERRGGGNRQLLSLLPPGLLLPTGGPALVHRVTRDTCTDASKATAAAAISIWPTEQPLRSRDMNKQNKKQRAAGELSPMVAAVASPGCCCGSAASSWFARAAALLVGSRREEESETLEGRLYRGRGRGLGFIHRWDRLIRRWRSWGRSPFFTGCGPVGLCMMEGGWRKQPS
jgi:hypothetical protein